MRAGQITYPGAPAALLWNAAQRSKDREYCGDGFLLLRRDAHVLAFLIDGLGSGAAAQQAADRGLRAVRDADSLDLAAVFSATHMALQAERGAALGGLSIDMETLQMKWAAVGDVDGTLFRCAAHTASLIQKGGTLGNAYHGIHQSEAQLAPGDTVILTSDGIRRSYRAEPLSDCPPAELANHILSQHAQAGDDCQVLVLQVAHGP